MTTIVIDRLTEEDFRRSIENRLRENRADAAIERLRALLAPYAGSGRILPERFLTVEADDLVLSGWDALGDAVQQHDRSGRPVTAISITFAWPGEEAPEPDAEGRFRPHVATSYFTDDAFPFSQSGREDLLDGYSSYGCTWGDDTEATDTALSLEGIDDLHTALVELEAKLLSSDEPDEEGILAGSLGSCLLSALLFQAVGKQIAQDGLPRPLCVMSGSNNVYPYFDAPVVGMPEEVRKAAEVQEDVVEISQGVPALRYSSLLMTGIPRAKKRAVLVLEEGEDETANRIARLRGVTHAESEESGRSAISAVAPPELPDPMTGMANNGPLLAKKPIGKARDVGDVLGQHDQEAFNTGLLQGEQAAQSEPRPLTARSGTPARQAIASLEPDLQERLNRLLSTCTPPVPGWVENDHAVTLSDELTADGNAPPTPSGPQSPLLALRWRQCLRRFGIASFAAIKRILMPRRSNTDSQCSRRERILRR